MSFQWTMAAVILSVERAPVFYRQKLEKPNQKKKKNLKEMTSEKRKDDNNTQQTYRKYTEENILSKQNFDEHMAFYSKEFDREVNLMTQVFVHDKTIKNNTNVHRGHLFCAI